MAAITRIKSTESGVLNTGDYGYPIGHLGHLTPAQEKALAEFTKLCQDRGSVVTPGTDHGLSGHDKTTLL